MHTREEYVFAGKRPLSYVIIGVITIANLVVWYTVLQLRQLFASKTPDAYFNYPFHLMGGRVWYFPAVLGRYLSFSFPANFVFLAILAAIVHRHRDQLVRTPPSTRAEAPRPNLRTTVVVGLRAVLVASLAFALSWFATQRFSPPAALIIVVAVGLSALGLLVASIVAARGSGFTAGATGEVIAFHAVIAIAIILFSFYFVIASAGTA
jgi:hypothetical protein